MRKGLFFVSVLLGIITAVGLFYASHHNVHLAIIEGLVASIFVYVDVAIWNYFRGAAPYDKILKYISRKANSA